MSLFSTLLRPLAFCAALTLLAACGGGGGNDGGQSTAAAVPITGNGSSSSSSPASSVSDASASETQSVSNSTSTSTSGGTASDTDALPPVDETPPEGPATGTARLSWLPPEVNEDGSALSPLAGYRIRYGRSANTLDRTIDIKNPSVLTYTVENLTAGAWYFEVVAVNDQDTEGPASNVGSKTIVS